MDTLSNQQMRDSVITDLQRFDALSEAHNRQAKTIEDLSDRGNDQFRKLQSVRSILRDHCQESSGGEVPQLVKEALMSMEASAAKRNNAHVEQIKALEESLRAAREVGVDNDVKAARYKRELDEMTRKEGFSYSKLKQVRDVMPQGLTWGETMDAIRTLQHNEETLGLVQKDYDNLKAENKRDKDLIHDICGYLKLSMLERTHDGVRSKVLGLVGASEIGEKCLIRVTEDFAKLRDSAERLYEAGNWVWSRNNNFTLSPQSQAVYWQDLRQALGREPSDPQENITDPVTTSFLVDHGGVEQWIPIGQVQEMLSEYMVAPEE